MKNIVQRIFHGTHSVIMTFVLMAAPIAAIVYFSEADSSLMNANYLNPWHAVSKTDHKAGVIKESFATEPIIALVKKLND